MNILQFILNNPLIDIPANIQNIGLALISIFLTAVIFIYTVEKKESQNWDTLIILKKVINVRDLLWSFSLFFIPSFFWGLHYILDTTIIISTIVGIFFVLIIFKRIYNWIIDIEIEADVHTSDSKGGYRQTLRNSFLEELKDQEIKTKVWSTTWSKEKTNTFQETRLLEIFFKQLLILFETQNWNVLRDRLLHFNVNIKNRNFKNWNNVKIIVDNILKINFKEYTFTEESLTENGYIDSSQLITEILNSTIRLSLESGSHFILFNSIDTFIKTKNDSAYKDWLFSNIYTTLFDTISESESSYVIWQTFPDDWKVKARELERGGHTLSAILFKYYINWMRESQTFETGWNKKLDNITKNLLIDIYPNWWAELLNLVFRSYGDNRAKTLLDYPPNFGRLGRLYSFSSNGDTITDTESIENQIDTLMRSEKENTIILFNEIFLNNFISKEEIQKIIEDLKGSDLPDQAPRKDLLLSILNAVITG